MFILLIVAGTVWLLLAGIMVLSLACAARRSSPDVAGSSDLHDQEMGQIIHAREFLDETANQEAVLDIKAEVDSVSPTSALD